MVKISVARIRGDVEKNALLPSDTRSCTSRITQLPRRTLCTLILSILAVQAAIIYFKLFYEPPLTQAPPYNVATTVALVTRYYELLVEMKYVGAGAIAYAPHTGDKAINVTLARSMGLDERVIETMMRMPYIDNTQGGWMGDRDVVFRDGRFVDYRKDRDIYMSRDPLGHWPIYNEKHTAKTFEEDMLDYDELYPKTAFPLTMVRGGMYGTGDAIVIDTETNRAHIICTQGDGNHDQFFAKYDTNAAIPQEYKIKTAFYGSELQHARFAEDFLRSWLVDTAALEGEWVPGGPYLSVGYDPELIPPRWVGWVRDLYRKSGWPSRAEMQQYLFPSNGTTPNPMAQFEAQEFEKEMLELRHNISVRYLPDWYMPVPRDEAYISWLEEFGDINQEQAVYARGNEEVIPLNLPPFPKIGDGAGKYWGRAKLSRHWELYGKGNWD